jgi:hypothetical protein
MSLRRGLIHGTRGKSESRACGPRGAILQAMLQGILQGVGPVGYYLKVLTGCFVTGSSFLASRFWAFCPGCFVPGVLVPGTSTS